MINSNLHHILHHSATPLVFNSPDGGIPLGLSPQNFYRKVMDGQGTKLSRNIAKNFNRLSRAHERYRRQTDRRQTDGRRHIATFAKKGWPDGQLYSLYPNNVRVINEWINESIISLTYEVLEDRQTDRERGRDRERGGESGVKGAVQFNDQSHEYREEIVNVNKKQTINITKETVNNFNVTH